MKRFGFIGQYVALLALACSSGAIHARTLLEPSPADHDKAVSASFRREFDASDLKADERLVVLVSAADGAVVYVNGREIDRVNMPKGAVDANTLALAPDDRRKGLFVRISVPPDAVRVNEKNVIEADVHSAKAEGTHLTFNLSLKTLPTTQPAPAPDDAAKQVLETFRKTNYVGPGTRIPDGYIDGGRHMVLDADDHAKSGREILLVDRPHDPELARDLEYAKSLRDVPELERAKKLSLYVDKEATPAGGARLLDATMDELEHEFKNKPLRIGDVMDQYHAGVCRHRSLLFKLLADEAGLKVALVRGNYMHSSGKPGAHAWNELQLEDGRRLLVDTMMRPKAEFKDVNDPDIVKHYVKGDGSAYYGADAGKVASQEKDKGK